MKTEILALAEWARKKDAAGKIITAEIAYG